MKIVVMKKTIRALIVFAFISIAGCTAYSPNRYSVGKDRSEIMTHMGQPERQYFADGIDVLHYPRGPAGSHTYFIYIDSSNRVVRWEQVLTDERFNTIEPGMSKEQVIHLIGITKIAHDLARNRGSVWHYRYETPLCKSFVIVFTPEDTVRSAGYRIRSGRKCKYVGMG